MGLYDSKTGEVLGRTACSWFQITLFYMFYYSCIACFFSATVSTYYHLMDAHRPHVIGEDNLLKNHPGLGYEPMIDKGRESNFVYVNTADTEFNQKYIDKLNEVLKKYDGSQQANQTVHSTVGDCADPNPLGANPGTFDPLLRPEKMTACGVNDQDLMGAGCTKGSNYGYTGTNPKPCILIRLNKVYGFKPEAIECGGSETADMKNNSCINNQVHLHCSGAEMGDHDNINRINYTPSPGFPVRYYPYLKQPGYLAPLVFIQLDIPRYIPVSIVCHAIAKNIKVDRTANSKYKHSVRIDVLVD